MQTLAAVVDLSDAYLPIGFDNIEFLRRPKGELGGLVQLVSPAVSADGAAETSARTSSCSTAIAPCSPSRGCGSSAWPAQRPPGVCSTSHAG